MAKKKKWMLLGTAMAVLLAITVIVGIKGFLSMVKKLDEATTEIITGSENYKGRAAYFDVEYEGYFSHLLVFPEAEQRAFEIEQYYYNENKLSLDPAYDIFLVYKLQEEEYEEEKKRLAGLCMEYKGRKQQITVHEETGSYTAYITAWQENNGVYEYALADEENNRIICVFSQLGKPNTEFVPKEYLLNENVASKKLPKEFSIYYFETAGGYVIPELSGDEIKSMKLRAEGK